MKSPAPSTSDAVHNRPSDLNAQLGEAWLTRLVGWCFGYRREAPAPEDLTEHVTVLGIPNARFWADSQGAALAKEAEKALDRERTALAKQEGWDGRLPPAHFLAISGGSDDGSFGAGLICGWSDTATMPVFKLVTGVSTGAMIAPFAFLGPSYMGVLRTVYTKIGPADVLKRRGVHSAVFGEALADTTPLYGLITRYINEQALAQIAAEYNKGRLLLIGTASLDAQRPVIWNIGAIADSGRPGALELIRKVILGSASIPGAFPPIMIDLEADGHRYQEMNVDGGVVSQAFLYPMDLGMRVDLRSKELGRERHGYIIRNSRLDPEWASVNRRFLTISGRAIATMIHYIGYNDLVRIYNTAKHDGIDYNLAYIEPDFPNIKHEKFDPSYMNALFDLAYEKGRGGFPWRKAPPILDVERPSDHLG
ncbi:MAG: patatin-like phospholipase family protein [Candidatus Binataceae bacterium]